MAGVGLIRLQKELKMLADEPPPGVCCWPAGNGDCLTHLEARKYGRVRLLSRYCTRSGRNL